MSLHEEIKIEEIISALNDALHTGGHRAGEDVDAAFRLAEARLLDLRREVAEHEHTRTQLERELREL
ncbi:hypothetical protein Tdes44962_MAKER07218 [Teratosphaeria destructans]|uniref:Uncharacterized protein n=1 Tax=Teratosphaeria destructans TaxID=418781 RepID=A0A9W7T041_9PEZI|nr:hypothetical protein Tdes44962_MAKER07218 [Teratosphaeria destructans]